jgi:hypothetical protein
VTLWQERQNSHQGTKTRRNTKIFFVHLGALVPWWQEKTPPSGLLFHTLRNPKEQLHLGKFLNQKPMKNLIILVALLLSSALSAQTGKVYDNL